MALTTQVLAQIVATETLVSTVAPASATHTIKTAFTLANGTAANQADRIWTSSRTLAASTSEDIDLAGVLESIYGTAATFVKVKAIIVEAAAANTNTVVVGGAAATQFVGPFGAATHTIAVPPGGVFLIATPGLAGWSVSAGSTDLLKILNGGAGTSVAYEIGIVGTSA